MYVEGPPPASEDWRNLGTPSNEWRNLAAPLKSLHHRPSHNVFWIVPNTEMLILNFLQSTCRFIVHCRYYNKYNRVVTLWRSYELFLHRDSSWVRKLCHLTCRWKLFATAFMYMLPLCTWIRECMSGCVLNLKQQFC